MLDRNTNQRFIPAVFSRMAKIHRDSPSIVDSGRVYSYGELAQRAEEISHHLSIRGFSYYVGVSLAQGFELCAAIIGCLEVGKVYVPLYPDFPDTRLLYMMMDLGIRDVITCSNFEDRFKSMGCNVLNINAAHRISFLTPSSFHDDKCCILYTSGSTGEPKAILLKQSAILSTVINTNYVTVTSGQKVAQGANIGFDAMILEMWLALLNGGTLFICPKSVLMDSKAFSYFINEYSIDILWLTSAVSLPYDFLI